MKLLFWSPLLVAALVGCGGGSGGGSAPANGGGAVAPAPTLAFSAAPTSVASGASSTLSWTATDASSCSASGAWSGSKGTTGTQSTGNLSATSSYTLSCNGAGGGVMKSATVTVTGGGNASVSLSANPPGLPYNSGTSTLTWSSANVSTCTASLGWSGSKAVSGTQSVGPLTQDQSYQLSCTGASGNAMAMTSVDVRRAVVSWTAPTQYNDGSPLTVGGFKVYWGTSPGQYSSSRTVSASPATIDLSGPGTYYFAVAALDNATPPVEGQLSSEVSKTVM